MFSIITWVNGKISPFVSPRILKIRATEWNTKMQVVIIPTILRISLVLEFIHSSIMVCFLSIFEERFYKIYVYWTQRTSILNHPFVVQCVPRTIIGEGSLPASKSTLSYSSLLYSMNLMHYSMGFFVCTFLPYIC